MTSVWLYRVLLRLLPAATRREAEPELVDIFLARLTRARAIGAGAVARLWVVAVIDVLRTAAERPSVRSRRLPNQGPRSMMFTGFARDIVRALRNILRAPAAPALAVVTLAVGLAASLVAFVLVRDVLIRPLPFRQPDRLVRLLEVSTNGRAFWPSYANCSDWRHTMRPVFSEVGCADANLPAPVIVGGRAVKASVARASRGLFEALGVQPSAGRLFAGDENRPGGAPAALVSARFWRDVLESRPLNGLTLTIADATAPVVGVLPGDFAFLGDGGAWSHADVWTPMERDTNLGRRTSHGYHTVARLRDGVTIEQARAEMPKLSAALKAEHREPTNADSVNVRSLTDVVTRSAQVPMRILTWAAVAVLFVSCLNFAAAVLARGLEQQRMLRLRLALGASRADLVRLTLAESLALSIPAVAIGLGLAMAAVRWLSASGGQALPRLESLSLDASAAGVAVLTAAICAVVAGLTPALLSSGRALTAPALGTRGAVGESRGTNRVWFVFVTTQMALTFVLLAGSGLLVRSLAEAAHVDLGYRTAGVISVELTMPASRFPERAQRVALVRAAADALRSVAGVNSVGVANQLPTATSAMMSGTWISGRPETSAIPSAFRLVDSGYFSTLGIPVRSSAAGLAPDSAFVDETVAGRLWKSATPIGDGVNQGFAGGTLRVAGVAGAVREWDQGDSPYGTVYASYADQPQIPLTMYVFARGAAGIRQIEAAAAAVDPFVPVSAAPLEAATAEPLVGRRLVVTIAAALALIACALACAGTYAMVMFAVRRGLREAAIRMALGASATSVGARFIRLGLLPAAIGLVLGLAASRPAASLLTAQLFRVRPGDPVVLMLAVLALTAAATLAVLVPARRAARVDPVVLLRDE